MTMNAPLRLVEMNADKRKADRHRTLKTGRVEISNHGSTFDVTIRDMSDTGARLILKDFWNPPEQFDLLILNPNTGKSERIACRKAWQTGLLLGVNFAGAGQPQRQTS